MSVVLALRERTAARFRRGIDAGVATVCTMDLPQIELVMDRDEARCVVVDPGEVTMEYLARIAVIVERRAGVLLLWSAFQPQVVACLAAVARVCPVDMAFRDTDEQRSRGLPGVLRPSTASVRRTLLHWSASRMSRLPARIALVLVGLMSGHLGTASVVELASLTGGTRRTLERRLKRAGFAGAAVLLQIARVLYARDLALNLASSVECIAASAGFGSSRALRAACRRYASCSSSELSNPFHAERIGRQLVRALLPRPRG